MSREEGTMAQDRFHPGAPDSQWYQSLERYGSCLKLLSLLKEDRSLIHQLGPKGITVLHKGVEHGCVALVRFILDDMFDDKGLCNCSMHGAGSPSLTREQLLRKTSSYGSTAVNMAVVSGSPKMVILLKWAIKMSKRINETLSDEMSSERDQHTSEYKEVKAIYSSFMKKRGRAKEIQEESTNDTGNDLVLPDVKDEDINILESCTSSVSTKVISVIEGILEDPGEGIDKEWMDMMKERCQNDVDFEFVPVSHVFPHFLVGLFVRSRFSKNLDELCPEYLKLRDTFWTFREDVLKKIVGACKNAHDGEEGGSGTMLKALFNILDPRGRTLLHAGFDEEKAKPRNDAILDLVCDDVDISTSVKIECANARDGAGRTLVHLLCIHNDWELIGNTSFDYLDETASILSSQCEQLNVLKEWCFPSKPSDIWNGFHSLNSSMIDFAILFDSTELLDLFYPLDEKSGPKYKRSRSLSPLQLAAALGRIKFLERILEHHTKFNSSYDKGLGNEKKQRGYPAIHCAAVFGQVEAIQSILKFPIYDPIVQTWHSGTALHLLLNKRDVKERFEHLRLDILLIHVLPTSKAYKRLNNDFLKLELDEVMMPKSYSTNEMSCINLLLQAGIDIWTPNAFSKELPTPGSMANDDARKWWYEKVVIEVVTLKTSISDAANATSVIAALVATASFIGPFQPPLGYGDSNGHYVQTDRSPVRVYLVCNSLSFFFSIASILMAVLPAIPMPKESLYDELLRSQRCLKGAALMLLISIICILISFSSASLAVIPSQWHERQLVVACVICGGVICVGVLVIYIIRLLRMLFHRNDWFRRKFAKHMYF